MNAENYVKAFQGIMGVYGLQFLLVPKKIVRFFYIVLLLFVVFCLFQIRSIIIPPVTSKGELGRQKETKLTSHTSLSLLTLTSTTIFAHILTHEPRFTQHEDHFDSPAYVVVVVFSFEFVSFCSSIFGFLG